MKAMLKNTFNNTFNNKFNNNFNNIFHNLLDSALDFIWPQGLNCLSCNEELRRESSIDQGKEGTLHHWFCSSCIEKMTIKEPQCHKCDRVIHQVYGQLELYNYKCKSCQETFHYFTRHISCTLYDERAKSMLLGLKYKEKTEVVKGMAEMMFLALTEHQLIAQVDCIVPVPIHSTRRLLRGFNQSELLADALEKKLHKKVYSKMLKRIKRTKKLKKLDKDSRKLMLKDAIIVSDAYKDQITNKTILLVDDIFTTGATLDACSKVLYEAGARDIYCVTFAMGT